MSEISIVRKFISLYQKYKDMNSGYLTYDIDDESILIYRNICDPDLIIDKESNPRIILEIGDTFRIKLSNIRINLEIIDDIKTHDDMELLLKYGRIITNNQILSDISKCYGTEIRLDMFDNFFNDNHYDGRSYLAGSSIYLGDLK